MTRDELVDGVKECLARVIDIEAATIGLDDRILEDLGADSLDLLDLIFQLEQRFQIKIAPRDLERRARESLGDTPLEVDGVYTPEALAQLRASMPEVPAGELEPGLRTADLPYRFRVETMVNLVSRILEETDA